MTHSLRNAVVYNVNSWGLVVGARRDVQYVHKISARTVIEYTATIISNIFHSHRKHEKRLQKLNSSNRDGFSETHNLN